MVDDIQLSKIDRKILTTAASFQGRRATVEEIAEKCKVGSATIHKKMQDATFRKLFLESMRASLLAEVPAVLNAFVEAAKEGKYKQGELILEMAGAYKKEVNANVGLKMKQLEGDENPFTSDDDREGFLRGLMGKIAIKGEIE